MDWNWNRFFTVVEATTAVIGVVANSVLIGQYIEEIRSLRAKTELDKLNLDLQVTELQAARPPTLRQLLKAKFLGGKL